MVFKVAISPLTANEAGEMALDVARRMKPPLCEELIRHCVSSPLWFWDTSWQQRVAGDPHHAEVSSRATCTPQHVQCQCGMQRRVWRGPAGAGPVAMGSLRAEQFGTGKARGHTVPGQGDLELY